MEAPRKVLLLIVPIAIFLIFFFFVPIVPFHCLAFSGGSSYGGTTSISCDVIGSGLVFDSVAVSIYWSGYCGGGPHICPGPLSVFTDPYLVSSLPNS